MNQIKGGRKNGTHGGHNTKELCLLIIIADKALQQERRSDDYHKQGQKNDTHLFQLNADVINYKKTFFSIL
jgi:hypothetical protein